MEIVAVILLLIGALAVGTAAEDNPPSSPPPGQKEAVGQAELADKLPNRASQPVCRRPGVVISQRDLTYPHESNRHRAFPDCQFREDAADED